MNVGIQQSPLIRKSELYPEVGDVFQFLHHYQKAAAQTDQNHQQGISALSFPLLGLFGEIGSLASALKKKQREKESYSGYSDAVVEEFGDVLWYFSNICSRLSLSLAELAESAVNYSSQAPRATDYEHAIITLAGKVGILLNDFREGDVQEHRAILCKNLIEVLAALFYAADAASISLPEVASRNLAKINSRWPTLRARFDLFDVEFPETEQLPRRIQMHIVEVREAGRHWVIQLWNNEEIGSPLTDNKILEDDYRFHDVFHLAYAAILGWSPCLRALLKVKRKSRPEIDENEDGARAALTEEGVSALVFQHATRLNYFENVQTVEYSLLKSIRDFVAGYEVERCPLWLWEKAILDGFIVFRSLRRFRKGIVTADLLSRSVTFAPLNE